MATVSTRCPQCRKSYQVPAAVVGHRGRCAQCGHVFRVSLPYPTEDDILQWLIEAGEEFERAEDAAAEAAPAASGVQIAIPV